MQSLKSVFGVIGALVPVVYCGGLVYYFLDVSGGSVEQAQSIGLGPTLLGLAAIGLLFTIPLLIKIVRIFAGPRSPGSSRRAGRDEGETFDADAVLARYAARQSTEAAGAAAPPAHDGVTPTRPTFGRKPPT